MLHAFIIDNYFFILDFFGISKKMNSIEINTESKFKKIQNRALQLLLQTSAHGIPRLLRAKRIFFIFMWFAFIMVSTGFGAYFIVKNTMDYLDYKAVTTINVIDEYKSQFPTISFCGSPNFNQSIDDLILRVRFEKFFLQNFSNIFETFNDSVYGKCYRFNSGKNVYGEPIPLVNSSNSGQPYGLRIDMNLKVPEENDFGELLVFVKLKIFDYEETP